MDNNQNNGNEESKKISEDERATQNNANNIRNAADVAIASKNPYAMAAGGIVKGADKLTGGRSTRALGKAMTSANKHNPFGRRMQNASNRLNESGTSDKIGKAASLKNAVAGEKKVKDSDVGNRKLKNNFFNRRNKDSDVGNRKLKNNFFNRRNNGKNNRKGLFGRKKDENKENDDVNQNDNSERIEESDSKGAVAKKKIKKILLFSTIAAILPFLLLIMLIPLLMSSFSIGFPALAASENEQGESETVNEKETITYESEINYYDKLKKIKKEHKEKCDEDLNINYIHAALIHLYYKVDYTDGKENELENQLGIDYDNMESMVDKIYSLMTNGSCFIDYEVNGEFYNRLKEDKEFQEYYKDLLKDDSIDVILEDIFELAKVIGLDDDEEPSKIILSSKVKVNTGTSTMNIKDYLLGAIYASVPRNDLNDSNKLKAYVVALTTNALAKSTFNSNSQTLLVSSTIKYCDVNSDCYGKGEITYSERENIENAINSVYGYVLLDGDDNFTTIDIDRISTSSSSSYQTLLMNTYSGYKVKYLGENNYTDGVTYGDSKVLTNAIFYDQNDYANVAFCGRSNATIKSSGCGTTAMSIIVSTYENNRKYDPVYMMNQAHKFGHCGYGIVGTSQSFFSREAREMGYKYLKVGKSKSTDLNMLLSHLQQGHLAIVHIGAGHFTSGGHYMVLGGVNPETKQVYVYDPYNKANKANKNRRTGNGWYSFNDIIVKEAFAFYIIWKG